MLATQEGLTLKNFYEELERVRFGGQLRRFREFLSELEEDPDEWRLAKDAIENVQRACDRRKAEEEQRGAVRQVLDTIRALPHRSVASPIPRLVNRDEAERLVRSLHTLSNGLEDAVVGGCLASARTALAEGRYGEAAGEAQAGISRAQDLIRARRQTKAASRQEALRQRATRDRSVCPPKGDRNKKSAKEGKKGRS